MTMLYDLLCRFPLVTLWSWASQNDHVFRLLCLFGMSYLILLCVALTNKDNCPTFEYMWFREPTWGLTGAQIRALLIFPPLLPVTFHAAPAILALMILYHVGRFSAYLGRVIVGAESDF